MLVTWAVLCAPVVVILAAAAGLPGSGIGVAPRYRQRKSLYGSLLLVEKLPDEIVGRRQITDDVDRQTLRLAYLSQYPQRLADIARIAPIWAVVLAAAAACYVFVWAQSWLLYLIALTVAVVAALYSRRAVANFAANDRRCRRLFRLLHAPRDLVWIPTEIFHSVPAASAEQTILRAADIRDRVGASITTVESVNIALTESVMQRGHPIAHAVIGTLAFTARAYDWLLTRLARPLFRWRVELLEHRENRRVAHALRTGDVFATAWLPAHYQSERARAARQLASLHHARDPLLRWVEQMTVQIKRIDTARLHDEDGLQQAGADVVKWLRDEAQIFWLWLRQKAVDLRARIRPLGAELRQWTTDLPEHLSLARRRADSAQRVEAEMRRVRAEFDRARNSREARQAMGWVTRLAGGLPRRTSPTPDVEPDATQTKPE